VALLLPAAAETKTGRKKSSRFKLLFQIMFNLYV